MALYNLKVLSFFLNNRNRRTFLKIIAWDRLLHCRLENTKLTSWCCILFFSLVQFNDWHCKLVILCETENGLNFGVALPLRQSSCPGERSPFYQVISFHQYPLVKLKNVKNSKYHKWISNKVLLTHYWAVLEVTENKEEWMNTHC